MITKNEEERGLGYIFSPKRYPHAPGYPRLGVLLRQSPSLQHFDPEGVHFTIAKGKEHLSKLEVYHPWPYGSDYQVCSGPIILIDRYGKTVEAFSFGGNLRISSGEYTTVCLLESKAPILDISPSDPTLLSFVEEIQIILAERRATWLPKTEEYEKRVIAVDPMTLYLACLQELKNKMEGFPHKEVDEILPLTHFVHEEIMALHESKLWPLWIPSLEDLI